MHAAQHTRPRLRAHSEHLPADSGDAYQ